MARTPANVAAIDSEGGPYIDVECAVCGAVLYEGTPGAIADLNEINDERDKHAEAVHGE